MYVHEQMRAWNDLIDFAVAERFYQVILRALYENRVPYQRSIKRSISDPDPDEILIAPAICVREFPHCHSLTSPFLILPIHAFLCIFCNF